MHVSSSSVISFSVLSSHHQVLGHHRSYFNTRLYSVFSRMTLDFWNVNSEEVFVTLTVTWKYGHVAFRSLAGPPVALLCKKPLES